MIERRWAKRSYLGVDVDVYCQGIMIDGYKTRDLCLGGVFLESPRRFPGQDNRVELIFNLGAGVQHTKYKIRAKVVRQASDGIGLAFTDLNSAAFRSLRELMRYREEEIAAAH